MKTTYTTEEVLKAIRAEVEQSSMQKTADRIGVSQPFLSRVLSGKQIISDTVAEAFGFKREREIEVRIRFRRIA